MSTVCCAPSAFDICPKCKRPKATAQDKLRWRNQAKINTHLICFADRMLLRPDEELLDVKAQARILELRNDIAVLHCEYHTLVINVEAVGIRFVKPEK